MFALGSIWYLYRLAMKKPRISVNEKNRPMPPTRLKPLNMASWIGLSHVSQLHTVEFFVQQSLLSFPGQQNISGVFFTYAQLGWSKYITVPFLVSLYPQQPKNICASILVVSADRFQPLEATNFSWFSLMAKQAHATENWMMKMIKRTIM